MLIFNLILLKYIKYILNYNIIFGNIKKSSYLCSAKQLKQLTTMAKKYSYYLVEIEEGSDMFINYRQALGAFMRRKGSATLYGFNPNEDRNEVIRSK